MSNSTMETHNFMQSRSNMHQHYPESNTDLPLNGEDETSILLARNLQPTPALLVTNDYRAKTAEGIRRHRKGAKSGNDPLKLNDRAKLISGIHKRNGPSMQGISGVFESRERSDSPYSPYLKTSNSPDGTTVSNNINLEKRKKTMHVRATTAANRSSIFGINAPEERKKNLHMRANSSFGYRGKTIQEHRNADLIQKHKIETIIANRNLNIFTDQLTTKEHMANTIYSTSTMALKISEHKFQKAGQQKFANKSQFLKNRKVMMK